jgi:iron complex outermembrane receptor protein
LLAGLILPTGPSSGIVNAGKSRIWGIEVESTLTPVKPLTFGLSYAYLNTELQSAFLQSSAAAALPPGTTVEFPTYQGNVLPFSPKNKFSANATYHLPVPEELGNVSLGATYTYTSGLLVSTTAAPYDTLGAYGLLGMNLHWNDILRSPIDAELFATNLTNRVYDLNLTQLYSTAFGIASRYPGEPRMYGVRVRVRFGK